MSNDIEEQPMRAPPTRRNTVVFRALPVYEPSTPSTTCRKRMRLFFNDPNSSVGARAYTFLSILMIVSAATTMCVETLPYFYDKPSGFFIAESVFIGFFSSELILRLLSTTNVKVFCTDLLNIIDFVVILPFYIELIVDTQVIDLRMLRIIRIIRVFRLFKISRYLSGMRTIAKVANESRSVVGFILLVLLMACVFFGSITFLGERLDSVFNESTQQWIRGGNTSVSFVDNLPEGVVSIRAHISPFQSVLDGIWWAASTITIVGYGDVTPLSVVGKISAVLCMLTGVALVGMVSAVFGMNFMDLSQKDAEARELKKKMKAEQANITVAHVLDVIHQVDETLPGTFPPNMGRLLLWDDKCRSRMSRLFEESERLQCGDDDRAAFLIEGFKRIAVDMGTKRVSFSKERRVSLFVPPTLHAETSSLSRTVSILDMQRNSVSRTVLAGLKENNVLKQKHMKDMSAKRSQSNASLPSNPPSKPPSPKSRSLPLLTKGLDRTSVVQILEHGEQVPVRGNGVMEPQEFKPSVVSQSKLMMKAMIDQVEIQSVDTHDDKTQSDDDDDDDSSLPGADC
eukprot:PhF_6_TR40646/c0_g1_i1/m.61034